MEALDLRLKETMIKFKRRELYECDTCEGKFEHLDEIRYRDADRDLRTAWICEECVQSGAEYNLR